MGCLLETGLGLRAVLRATLLFAFFASAMLCFARGASACSLSVAVSPLIKHFFNILRQQRLAVRCRIVVLTDKEGLVSAWDKNIIKWCKSLTFGSPPGPATLQIA